MWEKGWIKKISVKSRKGRNERRKEAREGRRERSERVGTQRDPVRRVSKGW